MKKLPIYKVTIDEEFNEFPEEIRLGMDRISNLANPAVQILGVAFSSNGSPRKEKQVYSSAKKMRIVAPILVPEDIYRNEDGEEYYFRFTPENIEEIAKDFMKNISTFDKVFTEDHTENFIEAYILEAFIVDSEAKQYMLLEDYNLEVPLGSFVIVQQFDNVEDYNRIVSEGKVGFSIEAYFGRYLIEDVDEVLFNKHKNKIMKKKFSAKKRFEEVAVGEELILIAEDLEVGSEVEVLADLEDGMQDDYTGEVEVTVVSEDETEELILDIVDGVIREIIDEEEVRTEMEDNNEMLSSILEAILDVKEELIKMRTSQEEVIEDVVEGDKAVFGLMSMARKNK